MEEVFETDLLLERILILLSDARAIARATRVAERWRAIVASDGFWMRCCVEAGLALGEKPAARSWQWYYRAETVPLLRFGNCARVGRSDTDDLLSPVVESGDFNADGRLHGYGRRSGRRIDRGEYCDGMLVRGRITYPNGDVYDGEECNGSRIGHGRYEWKEGGDVYTGHWRDGVPHGFGSYVYRDDGRRHVGYSRCNHFHGQGVYQWPDGAVYLGAFFMNVRDGFGVMCWPDGTTYEGRFVHDEPADPAAAPASDPWARFFRRPFHEQREYLVEWQRERSRRDRGMDSRVERFCARWNRDDLSAS